MYNERVLYSVIVAFVMIEQYIIICDERPMPIYKILCTNSLNGTIFPSRSCSHFVQCINDKPNIKECPEGTKWNQVKYTCDYQADCTNVDIKVTLLQLERMVKLAQRNLTIYKTYCGYGPENFKFPILNCNLYVSCSKHRVNIVFCNPIYYEFNQESQKCLEPSTFNCTTINIRKEAEKAVALESKSANNIQKYLNEKQRSIYKDLCTKSPFNSKYPSPDCFGYIECNLQEPVYVNCSIPGTQWNNKLNICDNSQKCYTAKNDTDLRNALSRRLQSELQPYREICDLVVAPRMFPSPDCNSYFECNPIPIPNPDTDTDAAFDRLVFKQCEPKGTLWNVQTNKCESPNVTSCYTVNIKAEKEKLDLIKKANASSEMEQLTSIELVQYSSLCKMAPHYKIYATRLCPVYILCYDNEIVQLSCESNLWWNSYLNRCDDPSQVLCEPLNFVKERQELDIAAEERQNLLQEICNLAPHNSKYSTGERRRYVICVSRNVLYAECDSGYYWNNKLRECSAVLDDDTKVHQLIDIQRDLMNLRKLKTVQENLIKKLCRLVKYTTRFPNADCSGYILCRNKIAKIALCETGLLWDVTQRVCVDPNIATCTPLDIRMEIDRLIYREAAKQSVTLNKYPVHERQLYKAICNFSASNTRYPTADCGRYLICFKDEVLFQNCEPEGTWWHSVQEKCVAPSFSNCDPLKIYNELEKYQPKMVLDLKRAAVADFFLKLCPKTIFDTFYPHPFDCKSFAVCRGKKYLLRQCRHGEWDPKSRQCINDTNTLCDLVDARREMRQILHYPIHLLDLKFYTIDVGYKCASI